MLNDPRAVREQYRDSSNFDARADMHIRFSTNPYGWNAWVFDHFDLPADTRVLEVGCGPGGLWRANAGRVPSGWRIVCSDLSIGMASNARGELAGSPCSFVVTDVITLPFDDESFDAVVANHMLYHVPDIDAALVEMSRVLKPGAVLFAATNGRSHLAEIREFRGHGVDANDAFTLENGPEMVEKSFTGVRVDRYEDSFAITEAEVVINYVRSLSTFREFPDTRQTELRQRADDQIAAEGAFRLSKDPGLIRGWKRS